MKISDIVTLAKAGYTPKDVLKLLEAVETSPEVKKTEADVKDDDDAEIKKEESKEEPEKKEEDSSEDDDIQKLVKLLKEE